MYAAQPGQELRMTEAEYLAFADEQEGRYEYADGYVYAMSGGSVRHSTIIGNMITELNLNLRDTDCTVTSSETRVQVARKEHYRYPDVTVFCGEPQYVEGRTDTVLNPALLVEVASPSSALRDREEKLAEYTSIPSVVAYLLVTQDEMKVERFIRQPGDNWLYSAATGEDGQVEVPSLGVTLALSDVYRKVRWDQAEDEA